MPAVTTDDYGIVRSALGNAEIKSAAIAKLYIASNNTWCNTGLVGAVAVCGDPNKKSYFLRLVNLQTRAVVWEQEFYQGFVYQASVPFFHTFETDHTVAGLSFADEGEAKEFFNKVLYCKNSPYMTAEQKVQAKQSIMQAEKTVKAESGPKSGEKKKKKNPFDFVTKLFKKEEPTNNFSLSGPTNFRHQSHIGWDPDKGFEINNIPPEWKQLFAAAGVKKSELKDAATAKYVMNVITDAMMADSGMAPPPPQPGVAPPQPVAPVAPVAPVHMQHTPPPPPQPQQPQQHYTPPPPQPPQPTAVYQSEPDYGHQQQDTHVEEVVVTGGAPPPPPPPVAPTPPPPPTPGIAPPPPPPTTGAPIAVPRSGSTLPPVSDDRGSLLDSIRQGATLRSVAASGDAPVDLKNVSSDKKKTLADTLALAMAARRQDLDLDAHGGGGHAEDDDEWSV